MAAEREPHYRAFAHGSTLGGGADGGAGEHHRCFAHGVFYFHADTAAGAKLALVTTRLSATGGRKFVDRVGCVTTPGETIDAVVTEAGVAVHPGRADLRDRLRAAGLDVLTIDELCDRAAALVPQDAAPRPAAPDERIVGVVEYRDGRVIDVIRREKG